MKKIILQLALMLLVLSFVFSSIVTIPSASKTNIGLVTYDGTAFGSEDDWATYNYLIGIKKYDVTVIHQWALASDGYSSSDWQHFDLVIIPGTIYEDWDIIELVESRIPVITMNFGYVDELELASGCTLHEDISVFNVVDNRHYITRKLSLGILLLSMSMWTDASDNTGFDSTVLVDSGDSTQGILIVHNMKKYVYFGWYRTSMMSHKGWDLLQRTIHWTLTARGKS